MGAALVSVSLPVSAAENVCLRSQAIQSWDVVDDRTLIVTDRQDQHYEIGLVCNCSGLDNARISLGFETVTEIGCLRPGDSTHFSDPSFGDQRCVITTVEAQLSEMPPALNAP